MGDKPDDVPSLEELGDDEPLPNYWSESTTITVDRWVKESLDNHRDGRPWNQYLEKLRAEHADPITFNDVDRMAEHIADELSLEQGVDADALSRMVAKRIDYAMLASKTAEELEGRLR